MSRHAPRAVLFAAAALLAACSQPATAPRAGLAPPPLQPEVARQPVALSPIHAGLSDAERVWHLRTALNVAALSCVQLEGPGVVRNYNAMLARHAKSLSVAYAAKTTRYREAGGRSWQRTMDSDMTRLYNHWAWPPAQKAFCEAAEDALRRGVQVPPAEFDRFALQALAQVDQPIARSRHSSIRLVSTAPTSIAPTSTTPTKTAAVRTR
jgi:hypothetical protein